jgi:hypothetical protein
VDRISGLAAPLHLAGRKLVANGPLCGGQNASARVYDLDKRCVIAELPVASPYATSSSGLVFGRIRRHYNFESGPIVDPSLSARFLELRAIIDADGGVLVCCDHDGQVAFTISEEELAHPFGELFWRDAFPQFVHHLPDRLVRRDCVGLSCCWLLRRRLLLLQPLEEHGRGFGHRVIEGRQMPAVYHGLNRVFDMQRSIVGHDMVSPLVVPLPVLAAMTHPPLMARKCRCTRQTLS